MGKETTPIEQIAYNNRLAFIAAFEYLGLSDIPDPKKWVEERKANMYKETLAKIDLDKFNFEGRCKQLEAENEKLKEILSELRYFSNLHLDHSLMKQIEDVVK
jgi:hypothetical protein